MRDVKTYDAEAVERCIAEVFGSRERNSRKREREHRTTGDKVYRG
jgi:hypothetical protein